MRQEHKYFGTYYGELVSKENLEDYEGLWVREVDMSVRALINDLESFGCTNVTFDVEDGESTDTVFFRTNNKTNFKKLMLYIFKNLKPDEFSEEDKDSFRLWWD